MQEFVVNIANKAHEKDADFILIPQNGIELCFNNLSSDEGFCTSYMNAIKGVGIEELFYDGNVVNDSYRLGMAQQIQTQKKVLVADYTSNNANYSSSLQKCDTNQFVPFPRAANNYNYQFIPSQPIHNENANDITTLSAVKNYLYLISDDQFQSKNDYLQALDSTNYDLLLIDLFFKGSPLTSSDVAALKTKQNGGKRLVIAYMNIGSAEEYRYYWEDDWKLHHPGWLKKKYDGYDDEIWVKFWKDDWQSIIYKSQDSYLSKILAAGFDGAYLDNVEAYYFLYHDE